MEAEARLLSAFVYHDQIAIITTSQHIDGQNATCRYFDCNRQEIPNSQFETIIFPMTVIRCPRRAGAEFVSASFNGTEKAHDPIPLIFRVHDNPVHELAVCAGPLYGNESKWLQIVEYVEHHKLLGVSYFYFTFFNLNEYDRKIVDYYTKFGYAEYTSYVTEYHRLGWMFHLIQTQECHHRSRYHSKWVLNIDIDERAVYTGPENFLNYLRLLPPNIGEISFIINRVLKTNTNPERFTNSTNLQSELMFLKYNKTTEMSWFNFKGAIRPDLVFVLFYHWSYRQEEGVRVMSVPKRIAHIRHYRNVDYNALNGNWLENYNGTLKETRLTPSFEKTLANLVREKVEYVYNNRWVQCEEIPSMFFTRFKRGILDCRFKNETGV
ncbi:hypothetical protein GCK72_020493 [Caenorhabditis remanei]|uniref:Glycosyltransferase family 92 protein n=1 Tax=Caenorhabditis remanei TaxID=31234 RepID=A0A6A5GGZ4_CAERE|nr:hypothetical protein GCK72_020493 [Caenorhabditis remanei]KAF1753936.1 hypothetical protein GCK72_020493 [Caenorhabditis remanei]